MTLRPHRTDDRSPIAASLAILAGMLHLLLVQDHLAAALGAGLFFLVLGVAQVTWGAVMLRRPTPGLRWAGAALLLLAPTVLYIITRTLRAPWSTGAEPVDVVGIITQATQMVGLVVLLADSFQFAWPQRAGVVAIGVLLAGGAYGSALAVESLPVVSEPATLAVHSHGDSDEHSGHAHGGGPIAGMPGVVTVGNVTYYGPGDVQGIIDHCQDIGQPGTDCWIHFIGDYLEAYGSVPAFDRLDELTQINTEARAEGHALAHILGHRAYMAYGLDIALTLSECSYKVFQGCIHGALQAHFADLTAQRVPLDRSAMNALCADSDTDFELYACNHGVGHGVMMHSSYDLFGSLDTCALLDGGFIESACYGGVYMENVAAYMDSLDPGYVPHTHDGEEPVHWVDPDDLAYPCNAVKDRYANLCWVHQSSFILHFNGGDFADASRICDEDAGNSRLSCYRGLGRLAPPYADDDPATMSRMCSHGAEDAQTTCVRTFVAGIISDHSDPDAGRAICAELDVDLREACHEEVGEQASYMLDGDALASYCAAAESPYDHACRRGAGID